MSGKADNRAFYKAFLIMTVTVAFQNLIVYGVNLADSVMMGAYSETALSGVGICNNIQYLLFMTVIGVANGMTVIASRAWGKKDFDSIYRISAVAMWLTCAFSVLVFVLCSFFPRQVIGLFTDKEAVAQQAILYLDIIRWSYLIYSVTQILLAVLRSVETVKIGFYVSVSTFGLNIFLNYIFIYGKFGAPELGVRGAALATLISRAVEFAVVVIYALFIDKKLSLTVGKLFKTDAEMFRGYFRTGFPLLASNLSWGIAMSVQGAIIGRLAESAIAANSIATTIFQIATVITYASSNAVCVLTAKMIGEGATLDTIKDRSRKLQPVFLLIGLTSSGLLILFKTLIIGFYNASPETVHCTNLFTAVLAVTIIGTSYEVPCLCGLVSGGGETSFVFRNDLIWMWGVVLPVSALSAFVFKFPVVVTFACLKADQVLKCIVAYFKVRKFNWIKKFKSEETE